MFINVLGRKNWWDYSDYPEWERRLKKNPKYWCPILAARLAPFAHLIQYKIRGVLPPNPQNLLDYLILDDMGKLQRKYC